MHETIEAGQEAPWKCVSESFCELLLSFQGHGHQDSDSHFDKDVGPASAGRHMKTG